MESVSNILQDIDSTDIEKLETVNMLLDKELGNCEIHSTKDIFNISTENIELKSDVLRKVFTTASNFDENINHFMEYFAKTFIECERHKLLTKIMLTIFETLADNTRIKNLIKQLGVKRVNKVILNNLFLHKNEKEELNIIFEHYLNHLEIENQSMFLNDLFEFSKNYHKVDFLGLFLDRVCKAAITHETAVVRKHEFWIYLINYLENCDNFLETKKVTFILSTTANLLKNEILELEFLGFNCSEKPWKAFLAMAQVLTHNNKDLLKPSLQLLEYIKELHFFWQYCILNLWMKHAVNDLKCTVLLFFLKQPIKDNYLHEVFGTIFSAINDHKSHNSECLVFKELNHFCENQNEKQFLMILDEFLNASWTNDNINNTTPNVFTKTKKKLVEFCYFHRFVQLLKEIRQINPYLSLEESSKVVVRFFEDEENFENMYEIRKCLLKIPLFVCPDSEKIKDEGLTKILELSARNSDELNEIKMCFISFLKYDFCIRVIKDYPLSIHVRIVIYNRLFNMSGYYLAQSELDHDKTISDFYEYLIKHINEKTYEIYIDLMVNFLDLMDRYMGFAYPEKACLEIVNIVRCPEVYTKYQIYCATEILSAMYFRFHDLWKNVSDEQKYYIDIRQNWKLLILETEDERICKQGLYFVLKKGPYPGLTDELEPKEYTEVVKKLLEKHLCDKVAKEIYKWYLNADLISFAFKRLNDIMEHNPESYKKFSKLYCEAVVSGKYINSDHFSFEKEELKFCFLNSENLKWLICEVDYTLLDYPEYIKCRGKIIDLTIEIYFNKLSNLKTKVHCLHVLMKIVTKNAFVYAPPAPFEYFKEDMNRIMNRLKEKYAENLKNDVNKLRIVQALFLLIPYVRRDFKNKFKGLIRFAKTVYIKLKRKLKRISVGILAKEWNSENKAARQICQYMYILLFEHDETFEELNCLIEKVKEQPNLASSFMPVLYHSIPFCKFLESEIEKIIESMWCLSQTSDGTIKIYSQIILQRLQKLYKNEKCKNVFDKFPSRLEQVDSDIKKNQIQVADVLKTDNLFLNILDPVRDCALETILYILPKLNQVDPGEWEDIMKYSLLWNAEINVNTKKKDQNETLKISVEEFLKIDDNEATRCINYNAEDILQMFKVNNFNL